jgi:prepilin-type N-terminal cleavage/methylation domain-containing protein
VSGARRRRGFTLLEVMLAMGLLAFVLGAVLSAQGTALIHGARVYNMSMAANLMHSLVLDLEEQYRLEPFPENSLEGRSCELPDGFDQFECEYDLLALTIGSDNVEGTDDAAKSITDNPLMQAVCGGVAGASPWRRWGSCSTPRRGSPRCAGSTSRACARTCR